MCWPFSLRNDELRTIKIVLAIAVLLCAGVTDVARAQGGSSAPSAIASAAPSNPAVLERPDLEMMWHTGMTLQYHSTSPGTRLGTTSRFVLEEFTKGGDCPRAPCSKWHVYLPPDRDVKEAYEYFDGEGNLYKLTRQDGKAVVGCYPHLLRFPLKVPGDAQDGCSAVALSGGVAHADYHMHYEWERVPSTYSGGQPLSAVHVTVTRTCSTCVVKTVYHRYYFPQKAVWLLKVDADHVDDLVSITP